MSKEKIPKSPPELYAILDKSIKRKYIGYGTIKRFQLRCNQEGRKQILEELNKWIYHNEPTPGEIMVEIDRLITHTSD